VSESVELNNVEVKDQVLERGECWPLMALACQFGLLKTYPILNAHGAETAVSAQHAK
jgi:hypothetical protein